MRPTFYGFEAARSGLTAAQAGLDTTGNNIANLSTEGYSRQIVDQTATYLGSSSDKIAPTHLQAGGIGVTVNGIGQIRSQFLDIRYRDANAESSANAKTHSVLTDIESNFDETQNNGLSVMFQDFSNQLQILSLNAGEVEYSSLVRSSAQKVTQTFNQYASQLSVIRKQTVEEMDIGVEDVKTLLKKIDEVNKSLRIATMQKSDTNALNDTRNQYLDKLSAYMNIKVTYNPDGTASVDSGATSLIDAEAGTVADIIMEDDPSGVRLLTDGVPMNLTGGSLFGAMEVLNGKGEFAAEGENDFRGIPYYQASLDALAESFSMKFNELNGADKPLFSGTTAADIAISSDWLEDPNHITATQALGGEKGKNDNILRMISAMSEDRKIVPGSDEESNFGGFLLSLMSELAIDVDYTADMSESTEMVLNVISNERQSEMGVSLNEETANLIKYQKAFAASARVMTALDEALDIVINRMGTVGR